MENKLKDLREQENKRVGSFKKSIINLNKMEKPKIDFNDYQNTMNMKIQLFLFESTDSMNLYVSNTHTVSSVML